MTTDGRPKPKRDRHPARSARVLTTGISLASVLGLTSAYAIAAQSNLPVPNNEPATSTSGVIPSDAPLADQVAAAPTQPAPATPATALTVPPPAPKIQSAPVGVVPIQSAPSAQPASAPAPITIMILPPNPPATRSSGSK